MNVYFHGITIIILLLVSQSCERQEVKETRLAKQYCGGCHLFPEPKLLDKKTWAKVLPQMAFRMGVSNTEILESINPDDLSIVVETIPSKPMVTPVEWESIVNYFITNSPDSLMLDEEAEPSPINKFIIKQPNSFRKNFITLVKYDSLSRKLFIGNRLSKLYAVNNSLVILDSMQLTSPPSHINFYESSSLISLMGIMDPNDQSKGKIQVVNTALDKVDVIIDSLQRPVYFEKTDFNNDAIDDLLVCSFGNYRGALQIFEGKENNKFIEHRINSMPGSRKTISKDFDGDGLKDVVALMTQGDERIVLYKNLGNFVFQEKNLIQFPPVYGSNYFDVVDFNNDGYFDILYVNGDNGDYSSILKPYHGIKIYVNDGRNNFKLAISLNMQGASQAALYDFDGDGDLDIAAIAFFADFKNHPERNFLFFENTGNNTFMTQSIRSSSSGRWLVMETADYDSDGDIDILLGAANFGRMGSNSASTHWPTDAGTILILENTLNH